MPCAACSVCDDCLCGGCAEVPPLPTGFGGIPVPTTVLSPTIPQQLNMHFLANNNSLSPSPLYFIFIGEGSKTLDTTCLQARHACRVPFTFKKHALLWRYAGANDYFSIVFQNSSVTAEPVVAFIEDAMLQLYTRGARKYGIT